MIMFLPRIRANSFDNFFDDFFSFPTLMQKTHNMMETNIKELDNEYQLEVALPGFEKKDIRLDLKNGYLTISAERNELKEEKDNNGRYIRRERYFGNSSRSFYVGNTVSEEDIHAAFKDGILQIAVPKRTLLKNEDSRSIEIE